jgi:hypothetical protein
VLGDPTEMPRHAASKTSYVGTLSDGETPGYWRMGLSTSFRASAILFTSSPFRPKPLGEQVTSRNQEHFHIFDHIKSLLEDKPLAFDREFSYLVNCLNSK